MKVTLSHARGGPGQASRGPLTGTRMGWGITRGLSLYAGMMVMVTSLLGLAEMTAKMPALSMLAALPNAWKQKVRVWRPAESATTDVTVTSSASDAPVDEPLLQPAPGATIKSKQSPLSTCNHATTEERPPTPEKEVLAVTAAKAATGTLKVVSASSKGVVPDVPPMGP